MSSKNNPPFYKSISHTQELFDINFEQALNGAQSTYDNFKNRNQKLVERQNDQTNNTQVQLISHFATLATLTVTILGLLVTLTDSVLSGNQQVLVFIILTFEIGSICFGAADYIQTINFHRKWATVYQNIEKEVDSKFVAGELQWTNELNKIESKHLTPVPETTKMWITYSMVVLCLAGLILLVLLFFAYLYDIPVFL